MNEKSITPIMVEHFNLKLKEENSCVRYVEDFRDGNTISYKITIDDKYVDNQYMAVNITEEFEEIVRMFFKGYGVENTGFSNTVKTIFATIN